MIMTADEPIDVQRFIDARGLSPVQVLLLVLCFLVVAVDGFDTTAIGFIAPALRTEWGATPAQLAPLFGAGTDSRDVTSGSCYGSWCILGVRCRTQRDRPGLRDQSARGHDVKPFLKGLT
jgi:hypothetical protein